MEPQQPRPIRGFAVVPAYAWAARALVTGWRLWLPAILLACLAGIALPFLGWLAAPLLLVVAVQNSANPNLQLRQLTYSGFFRVIVVAAPFAGFAAMYALVTFGIFMALGLKDFPAPPPPDSGPWFLGPEFVALAIATIVFAVVLALCVFVFTYAADGRFPLPEAATLGLKAGAKNLDKTLFALVLAALPTAAGIYLRTLIPHEYGRLAPLIAMPIIAFVSLAFARGYRQISA